MSPEVENRELKPSFMDGPGSKFLLALIQGVNSGYLTNLALKISANPDQYPQFNLERVWIAAILFGIGAVITFGGGMMQVGKNSANSENQNHK